MKNRILLSIVLLLIINVNFLQAQNSHCENLNFEYGNFTNWTGYTWVNSTVSDIHSTTPKEGFAMQTIMSDTNAYDSNTGNKLKIIPKGYKYCARLGDLINNTSVATLKYKLTVDSSNALIIYKFAVVFLNPTKNHLKYEEPRFRMTLFDENNDTIDDCSNYDVFASDAELSGSFNTYQPSGNSEPVLWRDWTTVGANLSAYIGKTIYIEFLAADCTHKQHYGYAYLIANCQPPEIEVKFCNNDTIAKLNAPDGFTKYSWSASDGSISSSVKSISIKNPKENTKYSATMTSATGCIITMKTNIIKYSPSARFDSYMLDCHSNEVQFSNNSATNRGNLYYVWDFGDGTFSNEKNPKHKFSTSGFHWVTLLVENDPAYCTDSISKNIESFSPPLVGLEGDSTFCKGENVTIKAYGAAKYIWNTGTTSDSIEVGAPGGKYWMVGFSSTGCKSDTLYFNIAEQPDFDFKLAGIDLICEGESTVLTGLNAYKYLWSTGDTLSSITIKNEGLYKLTGFDIRGCKKYDEIFVSVKPIPKVDFEISPREINKVNKTVKGHISQEDNVNYKWYIDNNYNSSGNTLSYEFYDLTKQSGEYLITLKAVNQYGCADTLTKNIIITPYFPNIFSPDGNSFNEEWKVYLGDFYSANIKAMIFDRWGEKVYESFNQQNISWNGKFKDKKVNPGIYVYVIKCTDKSNKIHFFSGDITVLH